MSLLEEGRVAVKKLGRDAGDRVVITKVIDKNFVHVRSASRPKDRKCNVKHLEFLNEKVSVASKADVDRVLGVTEKPAHEAKAATPVKKGK